MHYLCTAFPKALQKCDGKLSINVTGQKRSDLGKKASKTVRKEGLVPCNIYGEKKGENGLPEAQAFTCPMSELRKVVYTPNIYVVNINLDGEVKKAIIKELQFHPTTDALLHVDFYEVNAEKHRRYQPYHW